MGRKNQQNYFVKEKPSLGLIGHRTRPGMTGLDPLDAAREYGFVRGLLLRDLFTRKFWERNPLYIIMALLWDFSTFLEFWMILIIVGLVLLVQFTIDLIKKMIWKKRLHNLREKYNHRHLTNKATHVAYRLHMWNRYRLDNHPTPSA
jgi:hypothetical protein